ncbi:MAG TPA: 1-deoxy-D-xylulose-5-phosphate reductoisomerase [Candidatus Limnocylindria bacterium]|nr:1-deoxy-D-xylulose-5-phosphate reductoisomerase [Candidatus Limnocylindria bacterium]
MTAKRRVALLGSTGSIGTQALQVIALHPERFDVAALTAHSNRDLLFEQVRRFRPAFAALTAGETEIPEDLRFCEWGFGEDALVTAARDVPCDDVLVAVVGMAGLPSVLAARESGRRVLLANKEALVAGGGLVMDLCPPDEANPSLIPVDSEHSAVFQCLRAAGTPYESITLTASGGPFRTWDAQQLATATLEDALRHPTWNMGRKITVDSATMFNKALEIIEAKWLFRAEPGQIDVLIHPESVIHSMVHFRDGATLAQMGVPDMRTPIAYALGFPGRPESGAGALRLGAMGTLRFEEPDPVRFPALRLAYEALAAGGTACCVLNAANEEAAGAFLGGSLRYTGVAAVVEETLGRVPSTKADSLENILRADTIARQAARRLIKEGFPRKR